MIYFWSCGQKSDGCSCVDCWFFFILFCWCTCLFLCHYHAVFVNTALWDLLNHSTMMALTFLFVVRIVLTIQDLLCFSTVFIIKFLFMFKMMVEFWCRFCWICRLLLLIWPYSQYWLSSYMNMDIFPFSRDYFSNILQCSILSMVKVSHLLI
jgi:hypothetical protein